MRGVQKQSAPRRHKLKSAVAMRKYSAVLAPIALLLYMAAPGSHACLELQRSLPSSEGAANRSSITLETPVATTALKSQRLITNADLIVMTPLNATDMASAFVNDVWTGSAPRVEDELRISDSALDPVCTKNAEREIIQGRLVANQFVATQQKLQADELDLTRVLITYGTLPLVPQPWTFYPFSHDMDASVRGLIRRSGVTGISYHETIKY